MNQPIGKEQHAAHCTPSRCPVRQPGTCGHRRPGHGAGGLSRFRRADQVREGTVVWYHNGDEVVACDDKKDGRSIEANYRLAGYNTPHVLHAAGKGDCETDTWNINEGANIEIRICHRNDFIITWCSDYRRAEA